MNYYTYLLPLVNIPQTFQMNLAGITYSLTSKWNDMAQSWFLDIADSSGNPLVSGIPFVTGADLLAGLEYLGIDGQFLVATTGDPLAVPTLDNLGTDSNLYFVTTVQNNGG
jgi:hypothetical protein